MKRSLSILLGLGLLGSFCHAEARWCSIIGRGPNDTLVYPLIARDARVQGVVISRIQFSPSEGVSRVETISGASLLADSLSSQIKKWTLKTDATGDEPCQALVIADFRFHDVPPLSAAKPAMPVAPSVYKITVEAEPVLLETVIYDPAPRSMRFKIAFHHFFAKIFR